MNSLCIFFALFNLICSDVIDDSIQSTGRKTNSIRDVASGKISGNKPQSKLLKYSLHNK